MQKTETPLLNSPGKDAVFKHMKYQQINFEHYMKTIVNSLTMKALLEMLALTSFCRFWSNFYHECVVW